MSDSDRPSERQTPSSKGEVRAHSFERAPRGPMTQSRLGSTIGLGRTSSSADTRARRAVGDFRTRPALRRHWLCLAEHARHSSEPMAASRGYLAARAFAAEPSREALGFLVRERAATSAPPPLRAPRTCEDTSVGPLATRYSVRHSALRLEVWSPLPASHRRILEGADCLLGSPRPPSMRRVDTIRGSRTCTLCIWGLKPLHQVRLRPDRAICSFSLAGSTPASDSRATMKSSMPGRPSAQPCHSHDSSRSAGDRTWRDFVSASSRNTSTGWSLPAS